MPFSILYKINEKKNQKSIHLVAQNHSKIIFLGGQNIKVINLNDFMAQKS